MKRLLSAIIVAVFLAGTLSACGENNLKIDNTDAYVFNQDSQENFIRYGSQLYFAEGDKGIYFLNTDNGFLYVIDKATQKMQRKSILLTNR